MCRYPAPHSHRYGQPQDFAVQQSVNLSSDEQDALDGLLMLRRSTHVSVLQAHAASAQNRTHPDLQTHAQNMSHVREDAICPPHAAQASTARQARLPQRPPAGRSFAAAAAAASRAHTEYPIFFHHQPHRALKVSSKCARRAMPLYPPVSRQEMHGSATTWSYRDGQLSSCGHQTGSPYVGMANMPRQSCHDATGDMRPCSEHRSGIDDDGPQTDTLLSSTPTMQPWSGSAAFLRTMDQSKQVGLNMGFTSFRNHVHGPQYPAAQNPSRDDIERMAFAG